MSEPVKKKRQWTKSQLLRFEIENLWSEQYFDSGEECEAFYAKVMDGIIAQMKQKRRSGRRKLIEDTF